LGSGRKSEQGVLEKFLAELSKQNELEGGAENASQSVVWVNIFVRSVIGVTVAAVVYGFVRRRKTRF
jgi:hypothetical protein